MHPVPRSLPTRVRIAGSAFLAALPLTAAPALGRSAAEQAYSVAMHMHGSLSEGTGSMEWHAEQARVAGVDVIWWTDHDWRTAHRNHTRNYDFEAAFLDLPNQRITEPDDAYPGELRHWIGPGIAVVDSLAIEGTQSMRMEINDLFPLPFFFYSSITQESSRYHNRWSLDTDVSVRFALFPEQLDPVDGKVVFQVQASDHVEGQHILRYVVGSMDGEGPDAVALPYTVGQWSQYELDLTADAIARYSAGGIDSVRVRDNSMYLVSFLPGVRNGSRVVAFVDDYHVDASPPTGDQMLDRARSTGALYETTIPGVSHFFGSEISWYRSQPHMNGYAPDHRLVDYTGTTFADSLTYAVDQLHDQGGIVSLNHVFGTGVYGDPETPEDQDARIEYTLRGLIASRAYGAEVFETGYRVRHGVPLADHLATWDALTGNAIYTTGNGVTDSHGPGAPWMTGWGPWQPGNPIYENNFVTWVWATARSESAFVDALAGGRAWFGDPYAWDPDGTIDLSTGEGFPMGRIVVTDRTAHDLLVEVTHCPATPRIRLLQAEIRENPPSEYLSVNVLRDEFLSGSLAGGTFSDTVTVDTTIPSFVRIEVGDTTETWAYSNPVVLVPDVPQAGVPAPRVAAALGGVLVRSARDLLLTGADWTAVPPTLTIDGDESTPGLGSLEVDCGALGAPSGVSGVAAWSFDAGVLSLDGFSGTGSQVIVAWDATDAASVPAPVTRLELGPGAPNPFGAGSVFDYAVPRPGPVVLEVLDVSGRRVRTLVDAERPAGRHRARWDGRDHDDRPVADGVYFLRLTAAGGTATRKVARIR